VPPELLGSGLAAATSAMLPLAAAAIAPEALLLREVLAVSLAGIIFYTPAYALAGGDEIADFTFAYLNPAAQRLLHLPEEPPLTHLGQWPHSKDYGAFQFHVEAFQSGEPQEYHVHYQADGYDHYYHLAARRVGTGLLVSFTDTADQPRSPVEIALRTAQTREQAAWAEAEAQRQRLHDVLMAMPAQVATHRGPDHVFELVNPRYAQLMPTRRVQDLPIRQALPELAGQGIFERLDHVYHTGESHFDPEQETWVDLTDTGHLEQRYFSVLFQALRDGQGRIDGILSFAYDITEQVRAPAGAATQPRAGDAGAPTHPGGGGRSYRGRGATQPPATALQPGPGSHQSLSGSRPPLDDGAPPHPGATA
jgi:PAS domain-containing protein